MLRFRFRLLCKETRTSEEPVGLDVTRVTLRLPPGRAWKRARELGFPDGHRLHDVGRHAFRHLAVTRWLRAGVPLRTDARWGGWKDVATMLRWYESRFPGEDEPAAGRRSDASALATGR